MRVQIRLPLHIIGYHPQSVNYTTSRRRRETDGLSQAHDRHITKTEMGGRGKKNSTFYNECIHMIYKKETTD